mgnify:CR=1 FL=1
MVIGLSLTKGQGEEFDKETLRRLQTQEGTYSYQVAERKRQEIIKENKKRTQARQQQIFSKVENIESKTETINLDLADKISKIIPYSLIPIIPIAVAYFVFKGSK